MSERYPRLEINTNYQKENVEAVIKRCEKCNVTITGIIKGVNGIPEITKAYIDGGIKSIGTSRLEQIENLAGNKQGISIMLIRTPMLSEIEDVISLTDVSLNTELEVIIALNEEAKRQGKIHKIILMADIGDLREGFWDKEELLDAAQLIEEKFDNLYLEGVGTNVGCYGALEPTVETLEKLSSIAEKVEYRIGRKLNIVSGGASSSLMGIWDQDMPEKINHLRIGGEVMLAHTNRVVYGYDMSDLHYDVFRLKAEIVRVKTITDKYGNKRKEAVLDLGLLDYCNADALYSVEKGIKIRETFDDYTVVDIEDDSKDYEIGDILTFALSYGALVYLTKSRSVKLAFV